MLHSPERDDIECIVIFDFPTTNNKVEYEALVAGLDLIKAIGATSIVLYCDSVEQVRKRVGELQVKFVQIPREENEQVGRLTKATSAEHMLIPGEVLSFV